MKIEWHKVASTAMILVNAHLFYTAPNVLTFLALYILVTQKILMTIEYNAWRYPSREHSFANYLASAMRDTIAFPIVLVELFIFWRFSKHNNLAARKVKEAVNAKSSMPKLAKMFFIGFMTYDIYKKNKDEYKALQQVQKKIDELDKDDKMMF